MPLTAKGAQIKKALTREYGPKKGEQVLYAGKNAGHFTGIDSAEAERQQQRLESGFYVSGRDRAKLKGK
jgi:hypothetical protein